MRRRKKGTNRNYISRRAAAAAIYAALSARTRVHYLVPKIKTSDLSLVTLSARAYSLSLSSICIYLSAARRAREHRERAAVANLEG